MGFRVGILLVILSINSFDLFAQRSSDAIDVGVRPWEDLKECDEFTDTVAACLKSRLGQSGHILLDAVNCIGYYESTCNPKNDNHHGYHGGFQFNKKAWQACFKHFPEQMRGCNKAFPAGAEDVCCAAACTAMHVMWGVGDTQFETGREQCRNYLLLVNPKNGER